MLSKRTLLPIKHSPIRKIGILGLGEQVWPQLN